jgi:hypothetical protein
MLTRVMGLLKNQVREPNRRSERPDVVDHAAHRLRALQGFSHPPQSMICSRADLHVMAESDLNSQNRRRGPKIPATNLQFSI